MASAAYVGLMSGTSLDGVDGVLVQLDLDRPEALRVHAHVHQPFARPLADELLALNTPGPDELHRAALAGNAVARTYAAVTADLLQGAGMAASDIRAIGAHGQTVRHRPQSFDGHGYTLQLLNPALLAELSGIDVVADLRSRDVAAGGQGAPLVPAFHRARFARPGQAVAVLNLGGIGNLSLLHADGSVTGFDCGPANALLDHWARRHLGQDFDAGGRWAAGGRVDATLLAALQREPYFALPPPKSTGRDLFNADWLGRFGPDALSAQDVQATLAELTAWAAAQALQQHAPATTELLVCGGGAFNDDLLFRLRERLPACTVATTAAHGLPPDQVEACAFAWLAAAFVQRRPGNLASVTGARGPRLLGALYPA
ncbi:MAG: anhydro-N-acetylmuramic acid kinase [Piscinibacter sp.]|uniref:anhydro-N-acetylmuramic acid kinase n=1 Tax=Piscinibacter sp. TaxID=1903157 RepID=UPI002590AE05|nr:anhydro-N-acetylmuramic acid kinase [Piscinibacter sp.]MCW5667181.1 anhydro-N-acetylmuramic acid kinase [Piscinibacter sp.]